MLRRLGLLPEAVISAVSQLAFRVILPLLLFASAARVDYQQLSEAPALVAGIVATLLTVVLSWGYGRWRRYSDPELGVFVQGAYRSNLAIVGIALCVAAYGQRGLELAALPIAMMTALYNLLAVWILNKTHGIGGSLLPTLAGLARNPLLIGIGAGVVYASLGPPLPALFTPVSAVLSDYFLPLMLLCIGGAMQLDQLRARAALTWEASIWRLVISPAIGVACALILGVGAEALGVLFLLLAAPVAASSFVMVIAVRGDGVLAANIVVLTTLLSLVTVTLGFFVLSMLGLVAIAI